MSTLVRWESGKVPVPSDKLQQWMDMFDVTITGFWRGKDGAYASLEKGKGIKELVLESKNDGQPVDKIC